MKSLAIVMACVALSVMAEFTCDVYSCSELAKGQCASIEWSINHSLYKLQACPDKKVCDLHLGVEPDTCEDSRTTPYRFPGELCAKDAECFGGKCEKNVCQGAASGESCNDDSYCNPGLYCDAAEKKCVPTKKRGDDCSTGKCDAFLVCDQKKCTDVGRLENNKPASAPAACKSFYVRNGACSAGPTLIRAATDPQTGPITCPASGECHYKLGNQEIAEPCTCGRTEKGTKYCNPGKGDMNPDNVKRSCYIHSTLTTSSIWPTPRT